jgi:hypothetical protein
MKLSDKVRYTLFGAVVGGLIIMSIHSEHMAIPLLVWAGGYVVFITLIRFLESLIGTGVRADEATEK